MCTPYEAESRRGAPDCWKSEANGLETETCYASVQRSGLMTIREEKRLELASGLGVPLSDILTREQAAALAGVHPNTWTNIPSAAPNHYRAKRGHTGINFYDRRHIGAGPSGVPGGTQPWQAKWQGSTLPWPPMPPAGPTLAQIATGAFLDALTDDKQYKKAVKTGVGYP